MQIPFFRRRRKGKGRTLDCNFRSYSRANPNGRQAMRVKKRGIRKTKRNKRPSKYTKLFFILKALIVLAIIIGLGYLSLFTKAFEIQGVNIDGKLDTIETQNEITKYLEGYMGQNLLLFPTQEHQTVLEEKYPHFKSIKISRKIFHTLKVQLQNFDDTANIQINHDDGSKQFYIANELGLISQIGTTNENLPTVVMDVTGTELELPEAEESQLGLHKEIINQKTLNTLIESESDFEGKFNMQVLEIYYLKRARELHFYTERHFYVWIDISQDIDLQLAKLKKAMTTINIYDAPIEYIDLRISGQNGEKVIYKLSEQEESN